MSIDMTDLAEAAVQWARNEATRQTPGKKRVVVNSGHLLLGLLNTHGVPATKVRKNSSLAFLNQIIVGVLAEEAWVSDIFVDTHEENEDSSTEDPSSERLIEEAPSFKKALAMAELDAELAKSLFITPAHLLMGIAMDPTGRAGWLLAKKFRVDYVYLRRSMYAARHQLSFA